MKTDESFFIPLVLPVFNAATGNSDSLSYSMPIGMHVTLSANKKNIVTITHPAYSSPAKLPLYQEKHRWEDHLGGTDKLLNLMEQHDLKPEGMDIHCTPTHAGFDFFYLIPPAVLAFAGRKEKIGVPVLMQLLQQCYAHLLPEQGSAQLAALIARKPGTFTIYDEENEITDTFQDPLPEWNLLVTKVPATFSLPVSGRAGLQLPEHWKLEPVKFIRAIQAAHSFTDNPAVNKLSAALGRHEGALANIPVSDGTNAFMLSYVHPKATNQFTDFLDKEFQHLWKIPAHSYGTVPGI